MSNQCTVCGARAASRSKAASATLVTVLGGAGEVVGLSSSVEVLASNSSCKTRLTSLPCCCSEARGESASCETLRFRLFRSGESFSTISCRFRRLSLASTLACYNTRTSSNSGSLRTHNNM